jgi:glucokinase-like ROK family protein
MGKHSGSEAPEELLAIHTILDLIRVEGPITRSFICERSGYSRSTVSLNCDKLLASGLVVEEGIIYRNEKGKRTKLKINGNAGLIIGIELGATSCEIGLCDLSAKILDFNSSPVDLSQGPDPILAQIYHRIDKMISLPSISKMKLLGICMGLPSSVDYQRGTAIYPAFMPGWHQYPVREILQARYGCPVFIDNEVNTMALGEYSLGTERKYKNLLFVKAGTGIGAGIIVNGEIYRGQTGFAGNIGHIQMEGHNEICQCGKKGCLEAIASGSAIARRAKQFISNGGSQLLREVYEKTGEITAREVKYAADHGDTACSQIIREAGTILGELIGRIVIFFDPSIVIIGGGLTGFGPSYLSFIRDGVLSQSKPWINPDFEVKESTFGNKSGVIGSVMLCIKELVSSGAILRVFMSQIQK